MLILFLSLIFYKKTFANEKEIKPLHVKYVMYSAVDQDKIIIKGIILSQNGVPISNAEVAVKNTKIFTTSNTEGYFKLTVKKDIFLKNPVLTFLAKGFFSAEGNIPENFINSKSSELNIGNINLEADENIQKMVKGGYDSLPSWLFAKTKKAFKYLFTD